MNSEVLEKLARMHALGVADKELAAIVKIDESQLKELFATPEFIEQLAKVNEEQYTRLDVANRGWDAVEDAAVGMVLDALNNNIVDSDFALRAAVMANKANRRGHSNLPTNRNNPLAVQPGMQSVIQLHVTYVQKLEKGLVIDHNEKQKLEMKEVNFLPPADAKRLFAEKQTIDKSENELAAEATIMSLENLLSQA